MSKTRQRIPVYVIQERTAETLIGMGIAVAGLVVYGINAIWFRRKSQ